ncbi:hypothetical protein LSAT2_018293, partial [Lamellibrachia satsuma]
MLHGFSTGVWDLMRENRVEDPFWKEEGNCVVGRRKYVNDFKYLGCARRKRKQDVTWREGRHVVTRGGTVYKEM